MTWGQQEANNNHRLLTFMRVTWRKVDSRATSVMNSVQSKEFFDSPVVHAMNWTKRWLLQLYASQPGVYDPQPPRMWEFKSIVALLPDAKNFVQNVLWKKLPFHKRVPKRCGMKRCPVCGKTKSIQYPMVDCSMFKLVLAVVQHFHRFATREDKEMTIKEAIELFSQ